MKHSRQEVIKANKINFLIANTRGLIVNGNIKEAVACAKEAGLTPEQLGKLSRDVWEGKQ